MHHEELESLVLNFPTIKRGRFWMTFGQQYLTYLDCIMNLGMGRIDEVTYEAPLADDPTKKVKVNIVPLQFLKGRPPQIRRTSARTTRARLPSDAVSVASRMARSTPTTSITTASIREAYKETGMQGVSYTTGVPAMIGAKLFLEGVWKKPGVHNVEEFDPDPFMELLNTQGLPWHEEFDKDLEL